VSEDESSSRVSLDQSRERVRVPEERIREEMNESESRGEMQGELCQNDELRTDSMELTSCEGNDETMKR
jgi:hypothetical protein